MPRQRTRRAPEERRRACQIERQACGRHAARRRSPRSPRDARSNSSSESTGVPSNGRSRVISSHEWQPSKSSRTLHGHRPRDAVGAQQHDVQRVAALPRQALLGVVGRPHVVRRQRVDRARVGDRPVAGDLGPRADADALGLGDAAVARQRVRRRLAVGPHALLEGAPQLGLVRRAHDVVALVLEGRDRGRSGRARARSACASSRIAALAQGEQLLALGERADGDRPFLEGNWHREGGKKGDRRNQSRARSNAGSLGRGMNVIVPKRSRNPKRRANVLVSRRHDERRSPRRRALRNGQSAGEFRG